MLFTQQCYQRCQLGDTWWALSLYNLEHLVLSTVMLPEQDLAARLHRPVRPIDVEHHATMAHVPVMDSCNINTSDAFQLVIKLAEAMTNELCDGS